MAYFQVRNSLNPSKVIVCGITYRQVVPKDNEGDLREIPDNIKDDLAIKPVKWIDEVLEIALQYMPEPLEENKPQALEKESSKGSGNDVKDKRKKPINTH